MEQDKNGAPLPDVTQLISEEEQQKIAERGERLTSQDWTISSVLTEESAETPIDLSADASEEFRAQLNKIGNRYRIDELFAEGGYGRIFRAYDRVLGRTVVVKSLRDQYLDRPEVVDKFIAEAKLSAQLDHPSIVPLYSLDSDDRHGLHLAMKLVDGITLKEYLERLQLKYKLHPMRQDDETKALENRLEYFLKACDAVSYCHSRGVVHCDLKPENIMIGRHGEVYVMDWGSAAPAGTSRKGRIEGTPAYVAPEIPGSGITSPGGDIFALGMILYEIATLQRGVAGETTKDVLNNILNGKLRAVRHMQSNLKIAPGLAAIINKARAHDPRRRYRTVRELALDVRNYLFNEEISAKPDTWLQRIARKMYNNRVKSFATLATILCVFAGLAAYGFYRENRSDEKANLDTLLRLKLQRSTEMQADEIDNLLITVREQLKFFANAMALDIERPAPEGKAERIFLNTDFNDPEHMPPDLQYAPIFRRKISLNHAAYFKPSGTTIEELDFTARRLPMLQKLGWSMLQSGITATDGSELSGIESAGRFLTQGGATRRVSLLFNNGIGIRYPGMYEELTSDRFQSDWMKQQRRQNSRYYYWSMPYIDSSRHYVISCWGPMIDIAGNELGTAGVDLCFAEAIRGLYDAKLNHQPGSTYYILDSEGRALFSSQDKRILDHHHWSDTPASPLPKAPKFPFPIFQTMQKSNVRQLEYHHENKNYLISWSPIRSANWLLVQIIDTAALPKNELLPPPAEKFNDGSKTEKRQLRAK